MLSVKEMLKSGVSEGELREHLEKEIQKASAEIEKEREGEHTKMDHDTAIRKHLAATLLEYAEILGLSAKDLDISEDAIVEMLMEMEGELKRMVKIMKLLPSFMKEVVEDDDDQKECSCCKDKSRMDEAEKIISNFLKSLE